MLLLVLFFATLASTNIISIFPAQYSQYFDSYSEKIEVLLSEAILGEKNHGTYGMSLWIKTTGIDNPWGSIFSTRYFKQDLVYLYTLSYGEISKFTNSWGFVLDFKTWNPYDPQFQLSLSHTPNTNWIFIALSISYENKSILLYYNDLFAESHTSDIFDLEANLYFNSVLAFGDTSSFFGRIADFKIHNNIYYEVSYWSLQYSASYAGVSCTSLFPSIDYGHCDQWCESRNESFLPLIQPTMHSYQPYTVIDNDIYYKSRNGIVASDTAWNDYSITGWVHFVQCQDLVRNFFTFQVNSARYILSIKLISSALSGTCDKLEATISTTDGTNIANDSAYIISPNYIGSWFFFAVTINSGPKRLTLYSQNGINPPSASFPLLSSSIIYTHTAIPISLYSVIAIGGENDYKIYKGNYADFRLFCGKSIDSILIQYNNNIYSSATYLDPHCISWESIWYCKSCESGYFVKNGICQKCHPACVGCSSDDTEANCLSCASGYYAQPGHASLCLDYCPLGYTWDSSFNKCTGTKGVIANINFDDNLSGKIFSSNIYIQLGIGSDHYYPEINNLDPIPANKRGIFIFFGWVSFMAQSSVQAGRFFSSDFTLEIWIMAETYGKMYWAPMEYFDENHYGLDNKANYFSSFNFETNSEGILLEIFKNDFSRIFERSPEWSNSKKLKEWGYYSVSFKYDDISQSTEILFVKNTNSGIVTIPYYYKELPGISHSLGNPQGMTGFIYNFAIYNYGKTYSEIQLNLGTCSSCAAFPKFLNHCLPACDKTEYVDEDGNCQKCPNSCSWICSRANTCNLCYDDLCYKCSKYEIGACTQCVENAVLNSGQCECKSGYIKQGSLCVDNCSDGFYFDLGAQLCHSCPDNCLKCSEENSCSICKTEFVERNGKCECPDGYFLESSNKCLKCDATCLTCSINYSNCTSCILYLPILYGNKCYPCDSFEGYSDLFSIPISYLINDLLSQLASHCIEICGDGRNMGQAKCDDGNNSNGDGCSSSCTEETGWTCFGGTINSSDVCKDEIPPSLILSYLSESDSGYFLALSFSEKVNITSDLSKNIEIQIEGVQAFSWSVSSENSIYIITLYIYENVLSGTSATVIFIDPSTIIDMSGNQMKEKSVNTYLVAPFTYEISEVMGTSITTAVIAVAAGATASSMLLGTFNCQAVWSMVEIMQIQNYLIFLNAKYPNNLVSYFRSLSIANGNFLPNPFQKYIVNSDPFSDPPQRFLDENFHTDFLMNAGQIVCVWAINLAGIPICLILFKLRPRIAVIRWLKNSYLFAILLRIGIESFLEISLSVFLQLRGSSQPNQSIGYLSLILCFVTLIYLIITFVLTIWQVTLKHRETLEAKLHKRQFGVLYEGFKRNSKLTASFLLFQNLRRVLFVASCVFLYDYTTIQVSLSVVLSFIYTILLILLRPYEKRYLGNCLNIICEILFFASNCLILKFLDDQISDHSRNILGWSIIALLGTSLLLHIINLIIAQTVGLIQGVKRLKDSFMKNFANRFARAKRIFYFNSKKSHQINRKLKVEKEFEGNTSKTKFDSNVSYIETFEGELSKDNTEKLQV